MKTLLLLLIPLFGIAQSDTKILIHSDSDKLYDRFVSYLYDKGYSLERMDEKHGFLMTDARQHPAMNINYKLKARIRADSVVLSSIMNVVGMDGGSYSEVLNKKGMFSLIWSTMEGISKEFH